MKAFEGKILVLTGELSGERHALFLLRELSSRLKNLRIDALGHELLKKAGINLLYDYSDISVTGLFEPIFKLPAILKAERIIKDYIRKERPSLIILVDFPGFNLRIASFAKRFSIPVIYFIPPQIWAWGEKRINILKDTVRKVISILPFEKTLYDKAGIDSVYVGHPYIRSLKPFFPEKKAFLEALSISNGTIITCMPGSRVNEIKKHMPFFIKLFPLLKERIEDVRILIPVAEGIDENLIEGYLKEKKGIYLFKGYNIDALKYADVAIVSSGSASFEAFVLLTPCIVIYKLSLFSYLIAKIIVKTNYISIPNIVAKKEIYPEFVQFLNPKKVADKVIFVLKNEGRYMKEELEKVRKEFGDFDSYKIAADAIIEILEEAYGPLF